MAQAEQHWFGNVLRLGGSVIITSGKMEESTDIAYEVGSVAVGSIYFTIEGSGQGPRILTSSATDNGWVKLTIN